MRSTARSWTCSCVGGVSAASCSAASLLRLAWNRRRGFAGDLSLYAWWSGLRHGAQDFRAVRVLRAYYEDSGEDAFLMQYRLDEGVTEDKQETVNRIAQYEGN